MSAVGLSTKNAPSPMVVLPHYAVGAIAFIIASVLMFFAADNLAVSYVGPKVLSIIHLLILGWVTMIIFGALYQLIPVVMEVKLYSEKLAYWSFFTLIIGTGLMVWEFWYTYLGESHIKYTGGTLVLISIILFCINVITTARKTTNKTIENKFIVSSVVWLILTVLFGMFILFNSVYSLVPMTNIDLLKVHVLMGIVGWFMMLIIGVASTLMPMFFIAHNLNKTLLNAAFYLINIGIIFGVITLYFFPGTILTSLFALPILIGMILFFMYNYSAYKKRLRKSLDIGMKLSVFAFVIFAISIIFGILSLFIADIYPAMSSPVYLVFGASLILGFFTILILGQMYKTLPFIVWLQKYQDKVGKFTIPLPNDMYSEKVADGHYYSSVVAIITLLIGLLFSMTILIQISSGLFVITSLLYAYNTFDILFHKDQSSPLKKPDFATTKDEK